MRIHKWSHRFENGQFADEGAKEEKNQTSEKDCTAPKDIDGVFKAIDEDMASASYRIPTFTAFARQTGSIFIPKEIRDNMTIEFIRSHLSQEGNLNFDSKLSEDNLKNKIIAEYTSLKDNKNTSPADRGEFFIPISDDDSDHTQLMVKAQYNSIIDSFGCFGPDQANISGANTSNIQAKLAKKALSAAVSLSVFAEATRDSLLIHKHQYWHDYEGFLQFRTTASKSHSDLVDASYKSEDIKNTDSVVNEIRQEQLPKIKLAWMGLHHDQRQINADSPLVTWPRVSHLLFNASAQAQVELGYFD